MTSFATGGVVRGPGESQDDSVPAFLSPGCTLFGTDAYRRQFTAEEADARFGLEPGTIERLNAPRRKVGGDE